MALLKVICWAIIFITRLRFPPGKSLATILKLFNILNGFDNLSYSSTSDFFHEVHRHIISSCRFSPEFL